MDLLKEINNKIQNREEDSFEYKEIKLDNLGLLSDTPSDKEAIELLLDTSEQENSVVDNKTEIMYNEEYEEEFMEKEKLEKYSFLEEEDEESEDFTPYEWEIDNEELTSEESEFLNSFLTEDLF